MGHRAVDDLAAPTFSVTKFRIDCGNPAQSLLPTRDELPASMTFHDE